MTDELKGFGGHLYQRLQGKGLSKSQVYKALTMQKLDPEVQELGTKGLLGEGALLEIAKIANVARQKQLAELAVERNLPVIWVKELSRVVRGAEKASSEAEVNAVWDFFFEVKESLAKDGPTRVLMERIKNFGKKSTTSSSELRPAAIAPAPVREETRPVPPPQRIVVGTAAPKPEPIVELHSAGEASWNRPLTDYRKLDLELGRGLDVGTTNICSAVETVGAHDVVYNIQRNAFLDVRSDAFTEKMLMKLGIDHIVSGDKMYVIGDSAFELANIFEKNTRRPMKDGLISPVEEEALMIVDLLIGQLLGPPRQVGEICAFSIPADPIDADRNVIYHRGALETVLRKHGYQPKPMMEGHSVVFAELVEQNYTGIGVSCGGGMFNISIAYRAMPAMTFSTSRGGDWIDNNVSAALGIPASQVSAVKESGVDLRNPKNRVEDAIVIYYRNLIQYSLQQIRQKFESAHNMPTFSKPIDLVCAGGTSMIGGFIEIFREEFKRIDFPIEIREVRLARDPLRAVSLGCMRAAREETLAIFNRDLPTADAVSVARADVTSTTDIQEQGRRLAQNREARSATDRDAGRVVGKLPENRPASTPAGRDEGRIIGKLPETKPSFVSDTRSEGRVIGKLSDRAPVSASTPSAPVRDEGKVVGRLPERMPPPASPPLREEGKVVGKLPPRPGTPVLDEAKISIPARDLEPIEPLAEEDEEGDRPDLPLIS